MPISSVCQPESRFFSRCSQYQQALLLPERLAEELSQDLHASRSVKETPRVDAFDFSLAPDNQGTDTDAITAGSSVVPDISEHSRTWLRISDSDAICSYDLGTVKLDGRTVIELFQ